MQIELPNLGIWVSREMRRKHFRVNEQTYRNFFRFMRIDMLESWGASPLDFDDYRRSPLLDIDRQMMRDGTEGPMDLIRQLHYDSSKAAYGIDHHDSDSWHQAHQSRPRQGDT